MTLIKLAFPRGFEPRLPDRKSSVLTIRRWEHNSNLIRCSEDFNGYFIPLKKIKHISKQRIKYPISTNRRRVFAMELAKET